MNLSAGCFSSLCRLLSSTIVVLLFVLPPSPRADAADFSLALGIEQFRWQEFDEGGRRLLTEHGPRLVLAGAWDNHALSGDGMLYALRVKGYVGKVDYDGQDNFFGTFVASETDYLGWRGEFDLGWRRDGRVAVDLIGGLGIEQWRRDIRGGINAIGQQVSGLTEDYSLAYARAGIGMRHPAGGSHGYLMAGVRYPLAIDEEVVLDGLLLRLHPEPRLSGFLSWRVPLDALGISPADYDPYLQFHYESWRFARSDRVRAGEFDVWQPRSHVDIFGIMLGAAF